MKRFATFLLVYSFLATACFIFFLYGIEESNDTNEVTSHGPQHAFRSEKFWTEKESNRCMYISPAEIKRFPECQEKLEWLRDGWKSHACYSKHGVDGTVCTFRRYLAEVEHTCPTFSKEETATWQVSQYRTDISPLLSVMNDTELNYSFIKKRIQSIWPQWIEAEKYNREKYPDTMQGRRRLRIIIHLGLLTKESKLNFGIKSESGGPLGELVQWSDLIAALYALGHDLFISTEISSLLRHLSLFEHSTPCDPEALDFIITDIIGFGRSFEKKRAFLESHRCKIRLLDSFGTHAEFNDLKYHKNHKRELGAKNPWGKKGLNLRQFWTLFPHTPDNDFLGFVISLPDVAPTFDRTSRQAILVYGKEQYMWNGFEEVIEKLKSKYEIHATVPDANPDNDIFKGIINHGLLSQKNLAALLRSVSVFLGLGFPVEGPAPLEALAAGASFINGNFSPPKSRLNYHFLSEKPTLRQFTSQLPYLEKVRPPRVFTVNVHNADEVINAVNEAMNQRKFEPYILPEFTPRSMLLRINQMVSLRNLCTETQRYPPPSALEVKSGYNSCEYVCSSANLICEPSFFPLINNRTTLTKYHSCTFFSSESSVVPPADCILQTTKNLFSCASVPKSSVRRLCPCRDFFPDNSAICTQCV